MNASAREISAQRIRWLAAGAAIAALVLGAMAEQKRFGSGLLLGAVYLAGLGIGAMFILALLTVTGARRDEYFCEVLYRLVSAVPVAGVLLMTVVLVFRDIYPWFMQAQAGLRQFWLSWPAFVLRSAAYFVIWTVFGRFMRHGPASVPVASGFLVVGALTGWLAATDWLMSLEPDWSSTIFGMYVLLGFISSSIAAALVTGAVGRPCPGRQVAFGEQQRIDIAAMLFAANCLWMYLWFCQYMLIWYTNQSHEISYYALRTTDGWEWPFFGTIVFHWVLPFVLLLSRAGKRHGITAMVAGSSTLIGHWLDLYVVIMPAVDPTLLFPGLVELGILLGGVVFYLRIMPGPRSSGT